MIEMQFESVTAGIKVSMICNSTCASFDVFQLVAAVAKS
jgi:hypothetical protein